MTPIREETEALLEDRPELRNQVRDLLDVDAANETWTFDDAALDSGTFGELVSRGIVEKTAGAYRLSDPGAVRAALDGESADGAATAGRRALNGVSLPTVDRRAGLALAGALLLVFVVRVGFMYTRVFRNGDIVLAGNDPYFYRYWLDQLLASHAAFDADALGQLPGGVPNHDVLMIVVLWWAAALLGGTPRDGGLVLAWYPVLAGLLTAVVVYLLSLRLTADRRVSLAAVLLLALTPVHAYRTALGFGDHHAFDYAVLATTAYAVVWLASARRTRGSRTALLAAVTVGVGTAAQSLAWRAGPLFLLPIAGIIVCKVASDVRTGNAPLRANASLLGGLALGGVLAYLPHAAFGWVQVYRALAPALLFAGALGVVVVAEALARRDVSARRVLGAELGIGVLAFVVGWATLPEVSTAAMTLFEYLQRTGQSNIAETYSLLSPALGGFIAPILFFGLVLFLALPAMCWSAWAAYRDHRPGWLAASVYAWYLLGLSLIQVRFAGPLSILTAAFAGLAFVWLADKLDVTRPPLPFREPTATRTPDGHAPTEPLELPSRSTLRTLLLLFVLVASIGIIQTPVKMGQIAVDDSTYTTAKWIDEYAEREDIEYPHNYVFSQWGQNRVYNYFVNGQSRSYAYAKEHFVQYITDTSPADAYEVVSQHDTRFVVLTQIGINQSPQSLQQRLYENWGSWSDGVPGLGHYRAVYASQVGTEKVFEVVPGTRLTGTAPPNETFTLRKEIQIGKQTFDYVRKVRTNRYGDYGVTVPYSGVYRLWSDVHSVSARAVQSGQVTGRYLTHFHFDRADGDYAVDPVSGERGKLVNTTFVSGPSREALRFQAAENSYVRLGKDAIDLSGMDSYTICARVNPTKHTANRQDIINLGGFEVLLSWWGESNRFEAYMMTADGESHSVSATVPDSQKWAYVCSRYNGTEMSIWIDGRWRGSIEVTGTVTDNDGISAIGSAEGYSRFFDGKIDDIRVYSTALTEKEINELASQ